MLFQDFNLSTNILNALNDLGYHEVYPVQEALMKQIFASKDSIIQSATGSGKTAAYAIPIIEKIVVDCRDPQALILTPTRELALQVKEEFDHISAYKQLKTLAIYGKTKYKYQYQDLKQRTHVICATPGRLLDHMEKESFNYDNIKYVVIDEADEMFKMGFIEDVSKILAKLNQNRITTLCSATINEALQNLVSEYLNEPQLIRFQNDYDVHDSLVHYAYEVSNEQKQEVLYRLLLNHQPLSCIIFANTQQLVKDLGAYLDNLGLDVDVLHGGMLQEDRIDNINDFKQGKLRILVASDVAARGIDVEKVDLIINYELPFESERYIHRIGRSARNHEQGLAISLISDSDKYYQEQLETLLNTPLIKEDLQALLAVKFDDEAIKNLQAKTKLKQDKAHIIKANLDTLHLNAGKKKKLRAGDIVGAFCGVEGVNSEDIGAIQVQDFDTYVTILNHKADLIINHFKTHTIKNKHLNVEYKKSK